MERTDLDKVLEKVYSKSIEVVDKDAQEKQDEELAKSFFVNTDGEKISRLLKEEKNKTFDDGTVFDFVKPLALPKKPVIVKRKTDENLLGIRKKIPPNNITPDAKNTSTSLKIVDYASDSD